jgi:hypothetical protein
MSLARVWGRRVYGASAAMLVIPATIVCVLLALTFARGFGGLGVLGQVFSGPSALPAGSFGAVRGGTAPAVGALSGPSAATSGVPIVNATTAAPARSVKPSAGAGGPQPASGRSHSGSAPSGGVPRPGSAQRHGSAPPSGPRPQPGPAPEPTLVDRVVAVGTSVTARMPGPAGGAATRTLQSVGSTLDRVAGPGSASIPAARP